MQYSGKLASQHMYGSELRCVGRTDAGRPCTNNANYGMVTCVEHSVDTAHKHVDHYVYYDGFAISGVANGGFLENRRPVVHDSEPQAVSLMSAGKESAGLEDDEAIDEKLIDLFRSALVFGAEDQVPLPSTYQASTRDSHLEDLRVLSHDPKRRLRPTFTKHKVAEHKVATFNLDGAKDTKGASDLRALLGCAVLASLGADVLLFQESPWVLPEGLRVRYKYYYPDANIDMRFTGKEAGVLWSEDEYEFVEVWGKEEIERMYGQNGDTRNFVDLHERLCIVLLRCRRTKCERFFVSYHGPYIKSEPIRWAHMCLELLSDISSRTKKQVIFGGDFNTDLSQCPLAWENDNVRQLGVYCVLPGHAHSRRRSNHFDWIASIQIFLVPFHGQVIAHRLFPLPGNPESDPERHNDEYDAWIWEKDVAREILDFFLDRDSSGTINEPRFRPLTLANIFDHDPLVAFVT